MRRRAFIQSLLAGGASAWAGMAFPEVLAAQELVPPAAPNPNIRRVLAVFKCHFDAGFIDTQAHVVEKYFRQYFPEAIRIAGESRQPDHHRYVWTTGSWLLYEYLEQASPAERRRMEQAIADEDIAWHALPFNWQTELMDESLIAGSLALSRSLDQRFGKNTTGAKMTDVPGHTRGLIAPLAAHGITFLDIGVNGGSRPAEVPPLFVWQDTTGAQLTMMYHHEYGDVLPVPGSDLAIAIVVRGDNSGPHTPQEIDSIYTDLHQRFPHADVIATSLAAIADAVQPFAEKLPVVTQEIGDTWIYGVASDPLKVARYREVCRSRRQWIARGDFQLGDATDIALLRRLLLEAEHTWGTDTKTWLDFDHYTPTALASMLDTKNYEVVQFSWKEKRQDLIDGVVTLPEALRMEAHAAIESLAAAEPTIQADSPYRAGDTVETAHFLIALDPQSGAIHRLRHKASGREWAAADHPLALFSYQTLSQQDYHRFFANYIISHADWVARDFGKPNIERYGAVSQTWHPSLIRASHQKESDGHRLLAALAIHDDEALRSGRAAWPDRIYLELFLPDAEPEVYLNLYWFEKQATRMPEALWLTFNPVVAAQDGWSMDKSGEQLSPFDVVPAGARHMHAVGRGFAYRDAKGSMDVETIDAPLIALGERSPLNFSRSQPNLAGGVHCNLFNNAWGTNYIMWFGENMRFRFLLRCSSPGARA
jgi:Domain of unknown function (DUF5054)